MLHDLDQPEKIAFLHVMAHTPYARAHKLQGGKHIQGAGWVLGVDPSVEKMENVAPTRSKPVI